MRNAEGFLCVFLLAPISAGDTNRASVFALTGRLFFCTG